MRVHTCIILTALSVIFSIPCISHATDIYLLSRSQAKIYTFDSSSSGTVAPSRTILGNSTTLNPDWIYGLAVYNNEIFVTDDNIDAISVFKTTDSGDTAPTRQIIGSNADFSQPRHIVIDNGYIYCADETKRAIKVFKTSDSGNVAPTREITGFTSIPYACAVYNSELYVLQSNTVILVFDLTASGTAAATQKRSIDVSGSLSGPRGLYIANGIIYVSDSNQIDTYPASSSGAVSPTTTISGANPGISSAHSLLVLNGSIYVANYSYASKAVEVFGIAATGNVSPDRTFTATGLSSALSIAVESNGYVRPANQQQSGVTVSVTSSTENATSAAVFQSAFAPPVSFSKVTPLAEFEATVSSNGANGVFSFNSTSLNGTAGSYTLLKCFTTNGTSMYYGSYAPVADPETEGTWWLEDESGNYLSSDTTLTSGTNYYVNFVVKDNGIYDEDRTLGQIKDPAALGTSDSGGTGCVLNPTAGFSIEWILFGLCTLLFRLRNPGSK
ncbi:hypothetical protein [Maridesulfovibrio sp. FT414]|uniref:hypothetical protein n=1 Tax=Maridesulfovibrio sp. FT414 TaxID=2979469 RepID=UPI003D808897